jgi:hypothetical protein
VAPLFNPPENTLMSVPEAAMVPIAMPPDWIPMAPLAKSVPTAIPSCSTYRVPPTSTVRPPSVTVTPGAGPSITALPPELTVSPTTLPPS